MQLSGHDVIHTLAFHPKQSIIACGTTGGDIHFWDIDSGTPLGVANDEGELYYLDFNSSGVLAFGRGNTIYLWDAIRNELLATIPDQAYALAWGPGNLLAVGDTELRIIDVEKKSVIQKFEGGLPDGIMKIAWSPDGNRVAVGGSLFDPRVFVWNVNEVKPIAISPAKFWEFSNLGHIEGIEFISVDQVIFSTKYGVVVNWNLVTNQTSILFNAYQKMVPGASCSVHGDGALSPNATWVAYAQDTGIETKGSEGGIGLEAIDGYPISAVYITDVHEGNDVKVFEGLSDVVSAMSFNHDASKLAVGCFDGELFIWDTHLASS